MKRNQTEFFKSKTLYIGAVFITFFFLLLHGVSREFHDAGSLYLGNQILEFLAVITIYCCIFGAFIGIYLFYIRNEKNRRRKRNLKIILFALILILIFSFAIDFITEEAEEEEGNDTTTTSPASSTVSSSQSSATSSPSESSTGFPGTGTATTAPEQPTLFDPRLIIVVVGLLFTAMYFLRKTAQSGDKDTNKEIGANNGISEVEISRRERIKKNYLESSTELEICGADSSPVLTTREFQEGVTERFSRRPTIDRNITELTEVYELVKFSNQAITEEHARITDEAKKAINRILFPREELDTDNETADENKPDADKAEKDRSSD